MIYEPKDVKYDTLKPLLKEKSLILVSKEDRDESIDTIKRWIATILAEHYDKDPKRMIDEGKFVFQFKVLLWLTKGEIILITK